MTEPLTLSQDMKENEMSNALDALKDAASRTLENSISMPPSAFTSNHILQLEREKIFSKEWVCVGREDELEAPGCYFTTEVNEVPVVVTRDLQGQLRALINICQHRMARVADGAGKARVLTCPYHAWAYNLNGKLMNAPKMDDKEFDRENCRLRSLKLEVWESLIFVNLDEDAEPLAPRLAGLSETLKNYRMSDMKTLWREEQIWDANWKIACENFLEAYHLESLHRDNLFAFVGGAENTIVADTSDAYTFYQMHGHEMPQEAMIEGMRELSKPGKLLDNPDLTDHEYKWSYIGAIYPGLLLLTGWWGCTFFSVQPRSTGKARVLYLGFAPVDGIGYNSDEAEAFHLKYSNDAPTVEDKIVVAGIQRNAETGMGRSGPLHPEYEKTIHNFIRYLGSKLTS